MLQCFFAVEPTAVKRGFFSFQNFSKAFDFFFLRGSALSKVNAFVVPSLTRLSVASVSLNKSRLGFFPKKMNAVFVQRAATFSDTAEQYLFLVNNFFSKNKKFFFMRNSEIFNKSRYSRNRQTYRTGVFWCIWLTVLTVIGLYFYFYVFLIKFTYI